MKAFATMARNSIGALLKRLRAFGESSSAANRLSRVRAAAGWVASDATTSHDRELRLAVQTVVEFATYQRTRANFAALQKVLFWSSGAGAIVWV